MTDSSRPQVPPDVPHNHDRGRVGYVYLVSMVAAVGGLLFGFDTAIISGAIEFVRAKFELDAMQEGFAVSSILIGCIVGASFAGLLSDRFGRKWVLIITAIFYAISATWSGLVHSFSALVIARFLGGLAVGVSSLVSPLYIAEIAPARIRGRLVSLNQMAIVTGIFVAYFVNYLLVDTGEHNWRYMFISEAVPAVILLVALFFVPESPRWLVAHGQGNRALGILSRVGGHVHAQREMREIETTLAMEQGRLGELLAPGLRVALVIGIMLAIFQQITGINTVIYYAPKIFLRAGYPEASSAFWATVLVGLTNCVCTLIAICVIDKIGRKPLLLIGAAGMGMCLLLAEYMLPQAELGPTAKLIPILGYVMFFGIGLGATVWVVIAEIFPTRIRGRAMSIATVSLWIACFAVAQTFPYLIEKYDEGAFRIYAVMCAIMIVLVLLFVRETKGQSLEQIEMMWRRRPSARR